MNTMRASVYKLETGPQNMPIVSCCIMNRDFETTMDMLNAITGSMNGPDRVFDHGAVFLCCINDSKVMLVQNGTIIAATP